MNNKLGKACVSGGAGFIGSKLVSQLLQQGMQVVVIDNLSVGRRENIPAEAEFIEGDILDPDVVASAASCDVVFHLAARVAIRSSFEFATEDTTTNVVGTVNLLRAVMAPGSCVKKFLFASSMAVYADIKHPQPISEDQTLKPISPYGISKLAGEMLVEQLCAQAGIDAGVLRLFNTYGTGQALSPYVGVMTIFANAMLAGETPVIFGDGMQCRDFVHVDDVVQGFLKAMENTCGGAVYNIGSGTGLTVNDVYKQMSTVLDFAKEARYESTASGELRYSIANIKKARTELGYTPLHQFSSSISNVLSELKRGR